MKKLLVISVAAILAACSGHEGMDHKMDHSSHESMDGIVISSARVLPPFPGRDTAAGYFEITNHGDTADRLVSVTSPISDSVEIHNHIEEDGVMKMRRVEGVEIAPGETVIFKPGSFHLMMFKTTLPENQEDVSLTLNYENADSVTLIVDVDGRGDDQDEDYGSSHKGEGYGSSHKGD